MSKNSKGQEDKFSMRSLESAYLPFMFNENNVSGFEEDQEDKNSLGLSYSYKGKFPTDSTNLTSTVLQSATSSQRRMDALNLVNFGRTFIKILNCSSS